MAMLALIAVAGCVAEPRSRTGAIDPSQFPPGPATTDVTGDEAVSLFSDVCLASAPSYATAPDILAGLPVMRSAARPGFPEQYFHLRFNATIVIRDDACTMIAGGPSLRRSDAARIEQADPTGRTRSNILDSPPGEVAFSIRRPAG